MPGGKFIHRSLVVDGRLYAIAGANEHVFHATIRADGSLEPWRMTAPLNVNYPAAAVKGNRIYMVAGSRRGVRAQNAVFYGDVQPDGSIKEWIEGTALPDDVLQGGEAVVVGNNLYYIGGWHRRQAFRALIGDKGDLGPWQEVQHLLSPRCGFGSATFGGEIYVFGGSIIHLVPTDSACRVKVLGDGALAKWRRTASLPVERGVFATAQHENQIAIVGGSDFSDEVYLTRVLPDGNLADWSAGPPLPRHLNYPGAAAYRGWVYVTGGWGQKEDGSRYVSNEVFAAPLAGPAQ